VRDISFTNSWGADWGLGERYNARISEAMRSMNFRTPHQEFMVREVARVLEDNGLHGLIESSYLASLPVLAKEWHLISPDEADRLDERLLYTALSLGNDGTLDLVARLLGAVTFGYPTAPVIGLSHDGRWRVHVPGDPRGYHFQREAEVARARLQGRRDERMVFDFGPARCVEHDDCAEDAGLGEACWRAAHGW
jgi:hypothetical protein